MSQGDCFNQEGKKILRARDKNSEKRDMAVTGPAYHARPRWGEGAPRIPRGQSNLEERSLFLACKPSRIASKIKHFRNVNTGRKRGDTSWLIGEGP